MQYTQHVASMIAAIVTFTPSLDALKFKLLQNPLFNPQLAFKALDNKCKGYIIGDDLRLFLGKRKLTVPVKNQFVQILLRKLSPQTRQMDYLTFLKVLLPQKPCPELSLFLKRKVQRTALDSQLIKVLQELLLLYSIMIFELQKQRTAFFSQFVSNPTEFISFMQAPLSNQNQFINFMHTLGYKQIKEEHYQILRRSLNSKGSRIKLHQNSIIQAFFPSEKEDLSLVEQDLDPFLSESAHLLQFQIQSNLSLSSLKDESNLHIRVQSQSQPAKPVSTQMQTQFQSIEMLKQFIRQPESSFETFSQDSRVMKKRLSSLRKKQAVLQELE